jgi:hypothetical protein
MMESTPEQNKASVLEAFDTLFQQAAAPKTRRVGVPCWAEMLF